MNQRNGLDVHKKTISYCVKRADGSIEREGTVASTRSELDKWVKTLPGPWKGALEATLFTGWIYDYLRPHAVSLEVGHPLLMRAITASKKKNDRMAGGGSLRSGIYHARRWRGK